MIHTLRALLLRLSPHERRIRAKRDMELVLKHHGIHPRLAQRIAGHYFSKTRMKGSI